MRKIPYVVLAGRKVSPKKDGLSFFITKYVVLSRCIIHPSELFFFLVVHVIMLLLIILMLSLCLYACRTFEHFKCIDIVLMDNSVSIIAEHWPKFGNSTSPG